MKGDPMGAYVFILDRDDYRRYAAVLPEDRERSKLERALRKTHDAYRAALQRGQSLEAELASVSRAFGHGPEPELAARLNLLMAERTALPGTLEETASVYARVLGNWAATTWAAFDRLYRKAGDGIMATAEEAARLGRQRERSRIGTPEYEEATTALARIHERNNPLITTRDLAHRGRAAVQAFAGSVVGDSPRGIVTERAIATFVARHTRKAAA